MLRSAADARSGSGGGMGWLACGSLVNHLRNLKNLPPNHPSLEIAQSPSRCFNHPMRHNVLSTFFFIAILGMGCMGVAAPGNADEYCEDASHPQYDEAEREQSGSQNLKQSLLRKLRSETDHVVCLDAITPNPKLSHLGKGLYVWSTFGPEHKAEEGQAKEREWELFTG